MVDTSHHLDPLRVGDDFIEAFWLSEWGATHVRHNDLLNLLADRLLPDHNCMDWKFIVHFLVLFCKRAIGVFGGSVARMAELDDMDGWIGFKQMHSERTLSNHTTDPNELFYVIFRFTDL